jgi:hypothetical protein
MTDYTIQPRCPLDLERSVHELLELRRRAPHLARLSVEFAPDRYRHLVEITFPWLSSEMEEDFTERLREVLGTTFKHVKEVELERDPWGRLQKQLEAAETDKEGGKGRNVSLGSQSQ